jgi:hypothetical protein
VCVNIILAILRGFSHQKSLIKNQQSFYIFILNLMIFAFIPHANPINYHILFVIPVFKFQNLTKLSKPISAIILLNLFYKFDFFNCGSFFNTLNNNPS